MWLIRELVETHADTSSPERVSESNENRCGGNLLAGALSGRRQIATSCAQLPGLRKEK
jgi:hypothetical protein